MLDCKSALSSLRVPPPHQGFVLKQTATIPKLSEVTLQLEPTAAAPAMDRRLFKSPPIARLKSAPKARTEKNIKLGNYTRKTDTSLNKKTGGGSNYTRKLSIKGLFSPGRPPPSRQSPIPTSDTTSYPASSRSSKQSRFSSNNSGSKKKKPARKIAELKPSNSRNKVGICNDNPAVSKSTTIKVVEKCCHGNGEKKVTKWQTKVKSPCQADSPCCSSPKEKVAWAGSPEVGEEGEIVRADKKSRAAAADKCCSDKMSTQAVTGSGEKGDEGDESDPITIDSSAFTKEELETLITSLDESDYLAKCEHYTTAQHDYSATLRACEANCKSVCKQVCQYHCIRDMNCSGICANSQRCVIPNDEKVRERVIALLGTKIKFPVTRSIILQNSSNLKKDKLKISLDKINQKLNEKLKEWNNKVDAIKEEDDKFNNRTGVGPASGDLSSRKDSKQLTFSQLFAQQFFQPTRKTMAKRAEKEVLSDMSGCRYLRMRYSEREADSLAPATASGGSFLAKCEKGIKNTLRRGSVLARRLSTAAANGFPMKITIRKVERAADFSESFSSSSDTDYDEISSSLSHSSKSSSEESVAPGVKVPRMDKLVSILPVQVVQRLRSQKWRNWIAKVNAAEQEIDMPEPPDD